MGAESQKKKGLQIDGARTRGGPPVSRGIVDSAGKGMRQKAPDSGYRRRMLFKKKGGERNAEGGRDGPRLGAQRDRSRKGAEEEAKGGRHPLN